MTVDQGPKRVRDGGMPQMDFVADFVRSLRTGHGVGPQMARYGAVSGLALTLDFAVFLALNNAIGFPTLSGVVGYGCGIVLHYHLSRRFVFDATRSAKSVQRMFSEFVASGLVGLAITAAVIASATAILGFSPLMAKALAVAASFVGVFVIRRTIVFA